MRLAVVLDLLLSLEVAEVEESSRASLPDSAEDQRNLSNYRAVAFSAALEAQKVLEVVVEEEFRFGFSIRRLDYFSRWMSGANCQVVGALAEASVRIRPAATAGPPRRLQESH